MKKISLIAGFLLLGVLEQVQAVPLPQLKGVAQLHGYVQRVGQSEVKDQALAAISRLSGDYTEAGLSLNWNIRPATRMNASVNYRSQRPLKQDPLSVDIFSLTQTVYERENSSLTCSGGRLKNTLIGWHSAQDAPTARDGMEYARVYMGNMSTVFESVDGVRLAGQWTDLEGSSLRASLYLGKKGLHEIKRVKPVPGVSLSVKDYDLQGIKLVGEIGALPGLELGSTWINITSYNRINIQQNPLNISAPTKLKVEVALLTAAYTWKRWQFSAEWALIALDNELQKVLLKGQYHTYYLSIGWRPLSKWHMTVRYEVAENFSTDSFAQLQAAFMQPGKTVIHTKADTAQAWTFYTRYHMGKTWFIGLEASSLDGGRQGSHDQVLLAQVGLRF